MDSRLGFKGVKIGVILFYRGVGTCRWSRRILGWGFGDLLSFSFFCFVCIVLVVCFSFRVVLNKRETLRVGGYFT